MFRRKNLFDKDGVHLTQEEGYKVYWRSVRVAVEKGLKMLEWLWQTEDFRPSSPQQFQILAGCLEWLTDRPRTVSFVNMCICVCFVHTGLLLLTDVSLVRHFVLLSSIMWICVYEFVLLFIPFYIAAQLFDSMCVCVHSIILCLYNTAYMCVFRCFGFACWYMVHVSAYFSCFISVCCCMIYFCFCQASLFFFGFFCLLVSCGQWAQALCNQKLKCVVQGWEVLTCSALAVVSKNTFHISSLGLRNITAVGYIVAAYSYSLIIMFIHLHNIGSIKTERSVVWAATANPSHSRSFVDL